MSLVTPGELFEQDPALRQELAEDWKIRVPLEQAIANLDPIADAEDPVGYLSGLESENRKLWYQSTVIMSHLPSEVLVENYGREALLWVAAHSVMSLTFEKHREKLETVGGYDSSLFEKVRRFNWERFHDAHGRNILAQYAVADTVLHGGLEELDVPELLRASARHGAAISDERAMRYELQPVETEYESTPDLAKGYPMAINPEQSYNVAIDTPVGAILAYREKPGKPLRPQAVVSMAMSGTDELTIHHLQGLKGWRVNPEATNRNERYTGRISARGLAPLDWQLMMVNVVEQVAQNMQLKSIGILSGENTYWANHDVGRTDGRYLSPEMVAKAYDEPARRLGFTPGSDGNWHRPIASA